MNKKLAGSFLLFCCYIESSDNKRLVEDFSLVQSPKLKRLNSGSAAPEILSNKAIIQGCTKAAIQNPPQRKKVKLEPEYFHFRELQDPSYVSKKQSTRQGSIDASMSLSQMNLQQMRKKMNSVTHCLKGDALLLRKNELDEAFLFEVSDPEVKSFLKALIDGRISTSSSTADDVTELESKQLRACLNSYSIGCYQILGKINTEIHAREIINFIEGDIKAINQDAKQRIPYTSHQGKFVVSTVEINNKPFKLSFLVKNSDIMKKIIYEYMSVQSFSRGSQTQDVRSRQLFNQLETLQQSVICDDFITKTSLQERYQEMVQLYQTIESTLSEQVKMYAQPSFVSLKKSIEEFEEN